MKGVPVRIEIGPRDIKNEQVVFVRRDTGEKITVSESELLPRLKSLLDEIQANMFRQAQVFLTKILEKWTTLMSLSKSLMKKEVL